MAYIQPVTDDDSLRSALRTVLEEAEMNGVEVEGSLKIQTTANQRPNWEIQIWEVE